MARSFLAILAALVLSSAAQAQTIAPVRLSKGQVTPAFTMTVGGAAVTSPVMDFSIFTGVTIMFQTNATTPTCTTFTNVSVTVSGSLTATGTFVNETDPLNVWTRTVTTPASYSLSTTFPFVKFSMPATGGTIGCKLDVLVIGQTLGPSLVCVGEIKSGTVVPNGITSLDPVIVGGVGNEFSPVIHAARTDSSGDWLVADAVVASSVPSLPTITPISVGATATLVFTATSTQRSVILQQEAATNGAVCAWGTNSAFVTTSRFNFALASTMATNDGTGGSVPLGPMPVGTTVYCVRNGASNASIGITPH